MTDKPSKDFLEYAYSDEDAEEDEETIRERQILKECFKMEDFLELYKIFTKTKLTLQELKY